MKTTLRIVLLLGLLLACPRLALAQDSEYRLDFNRTFGYGSGINMRGSMELALVGDLQNVRSVSYRMDGQEVAALSSAPFTYAFNTSQYPTGLHEMTAVVETLDGRQVTTPPVQRRFISAEEESQSMRKILIPVLGLVLGLTLLGAGSQLWAARKGNTLAPGTPRNYGWMGGTICPRCGRAYAVHIWSLSMLVGRLDRCDFCGHWAMITRRSPQELAAAEQAEHRALHASEKQLPGLGDPAESEEERLKKLLDDSRYDGGG